MNENELKELWKSEESKSLPIINFEKVQKNIASWQNKLHQKIKFDVIISGAFYLILIPLCFVLPKLAYFMPIILLIALWGYWKMWGIYQLETKTDDYKTIKEFLTKKNGMLSNYIRRTRQIVYLTMPLFVIATILVQVTFNEFLEMWVRVIFLVIFLEIFAIIFSEVYFRIMYIPAIRKSQELIEQLESEK